MAAPVSDAAQSVFLGQFAWLLLKYQGPLTHDILCGLCSHDSVDSPPVGSIAGFQGRPSLGSYCFAVCVVRMGFHPGIQNLLSLFLGTRKVFMAQRAKNAFKNAASRTACALKGRNPPTRQQHKWTCSTMLASKYRGDPSTCPLPSILQCLLCWQALGLEQSSPKKK